MGSGEPPGSWYWPWLSKDSSQSSPLESRYLPNLQLLMMTLFHVTNYCVIIIKPPSAVIFLDFVLGSCWVVHSLHVCWLLHWQSGGHLCRAAGLVSWTSRPHTPFGFTYCFFVFPHVQSVSRLNIHPFILLWEWHLRHSWTLCYDRSSCCPGWGH